MENTSAVTVAALQPQRPLCDDDETLSIRARLLSKNKCEVQQLADKNERGNYKYDMDKLNVNQFELQV